MLLTRIRKSVQENDEGFTLIELLVVIIIIGILAAIAIPVFLNQRKKGYDTASKSDLRNMASSEETYLTDYNTYATTYAQLVSAESFKSSSSATDSVKGATAATGYCLQSISQSGTTFYYSSTGGGLSTTACTNQ